MRLLSAVLVLFAFAACTTEKTIVQEVVVTPTPGQQQLVPPAQIPPTEPPPTSTPVPPPPTLPPPPPPTLPPPPVQPVAPQQPASDCHPSYPTLCLPGSPDLDCGDISARRFPVTGSDPHGFDQDGDGVGCESG